MNPAHSPSHGKLTDAQLAAMQHHADPLADQTIERILGEWPQGDVGVDAPQWARIDTVNRLFAQREDNASLQGWTAHGDGVDAAMSRALNHYVQTAQLLPPWADARKIERAEKLFMEHGALSCILLFCASLPECYVIPDLSSVLHTSGQLEQNAEYRIRSTAAMIFPVMMHGGLGQRGAGVAQVLKVRLIHATIRNLILHGSPQSAVARMLEGDAGSVAPQAMPRRGGRQSLLQTLYARGWNLQANGLPCNQEVLAYTLLTFGYVFLRSLRRLGIGLPHADEEATCTPGTWWAMFWVSSVP